MNTGTISLTVEDLAYLVTLTSVTTGLAVAVGWFVLSTLYDLAAYVGRLLLARLRSVPASSTARNGPVTT